MIIKKNKTLLIMRFNGKKKFTINATKPTTINPNKPFSSIEILFFMPNKKIFSK